MVNCTTNYFTSYKISKNYFSSISKKKKKKHPIQFDIKFQAKSRIIQNVRVVDCHQDSVGSKLSFQTHPQHLPYIYRSYRGPLQQGQTSDHWRIASSWRGSHHRWGSSPRGDCLGEYRGVGSTGLASFCTVPHHSVTAIHVKIIIFLWKESNIMNLWREINQKRKGETSIPQNSNT
jgi:hypothetical protein